MNPNTPNFTDTEERNKVANTYKGGNAPKSAVLSGLIEPDKQAGWFGNKDTGFEVFFTKRKVGGTEINGRKISGWKEVPTVLDWDSTYRHSEWYENFNELARLFSENKLGEIIKTGDLNKQEMEYNHSIAVFINSFLQKHNIKRIETTDVSDMLSLLEDEHVVKKHAEVMYFNGLNQMVEDEKYEQIEINGDTKIVKYNDFKITTYSQIVDKWFDYIDKMEDMTVYQANMPREDLLQIDAKHRWDKAYTSKMFAKFKDLERSRFTDMWKTMLSLTTYQDTVEGQPETPDDWDKNRGSSWFESMERLKDSLDKVLKLLREIAREELDTKLHYVWIIEAHETGYPHIHLAIFGDVSEWLSERENQLRVQKLLEEKHDLGKSGVATDIETKPPSGDGAIDKLSSYLMKYFQKNFGEFKEDYEDKTLDDKDWGTIVYNACMWLSGYRTWGTSREVGSIMKQEENESEKYYNDLGATTSSTDDKTFHDAIEGKANDQTKRRIEKRDLFRKAIKERKTS
jgi:hypothetical protein